MKFDLSLLLIVFQEINGNLKFLNFIFLLFYNLIFFHINFTRFKANVQIVARKVTFLVKFIIFNESQLIFEISIYLIIFTWDIFASFRDFQLNLFF